jgi:hypothetical protein
MDMIEIIGGNDGQGFSAIGRQFGLDATQSRAAVEQLAPAVMAGIRRNSQSPDGLSSLLGALVNGGHGRYLEGDDGNVTADGNAILGHVFGSKDVSRGVAAQAANFSGLDAGLLKQMLPVVAAMVMGALAKNTMGGASAQQGGGLGEILGSVLGGGQSSGAGAGGGLGGMLGQVLGGSSAGGGGQAGGGLADVLGGLLAGQAAPSGRAGAQGGGLDDILGSIFGGGAEPGVREEATRRANDRLGGLLGAGTDRGNAADDLLSSLTRSLDRR